MPSMSARVRPRCLSYTGDIQHPVSSSSSPESDHLVLLTEVHGSSGVLASVTTQELGVGTSSCPWLIIAQPGQRINITLMDFAAYDRSPSLVVADAAAHSRQRRDLSPTGRTGQSRRQYDVGARYCREYAVLSEDTATKNLVVCSDHRPRSRLVYTSKSHKLKVTFSDVTSSTTDADADDHSQIYFAIKYEGLCAISMSRIAMHCNLNAARHRANRPRFNYKSWLIMH